MKKFKLQISNVSYWSFSGSDWHNPDMDVKTGNETVESAGSLGLTIIIEADSIEMAREKVNKALTKLVNEQ